MKPWSQVEWAQPAIVTISSAALLSACRSLDAASAVVAIVGCVAVVLAIWSPIGAIGAVVLTLPWFFEPVPVGSSAFPASELLLFAAAVGSAGRVALEQRNILGRGEFTIPAGLARLKSSRVWMAAWGLAFFGFLHLIWLFDRSDRSAALREWRWTLLEPALLVTLVTLASGSRWATLYLSGCLVAAMTIAGLSGLTDLSRGDGVIAEGVRRVTGPYRHPNALGSFLSRCWALAASWWVVDRNARRWLTLSLVIGGLGMIATFSRGSLAATAVVVVVLAAVAAPRFRVVAIGVLIGGTALLLSVAGARMVDAFGGGSASLRIDIWHSALAMIRDNPLWGYGPDGFLYAYTPRYVDPTAWAERFTSHAHNLLLDFWVRLGIIGGAVVVVAFGICLSSIARFVRGGASRRVFADVALIGLLAAFLNGMVDNGYFTHDLAMSMWLLVWLAMDRRASVATEGMVVVAGTRRRRIGLHRLAPVR